MVYNMTYCIKKKEIVVKKPFIISLNPRHTMIDYTDFSKKKKKYRLNGRYPIDKVRCIIK